MKYIWMAFTAVSVAALITPGHWGVPNGGVVCKLAASTGFILTALSCGAHRSWFGRAILIGLVFSWFGDAFLTKSSLFLAGLVSFLLGHICYVVASAVWGIRWPRAALGAVLVIPLAGGIAAWLLPHVDADMKIPVIAYMVVISSMVVAALGAHGKGAPLSLVIGAFMFYFSDIAVAIGRFMETDFPHHLWGLPLYFGGQLVLAVTAGAGHRGAASTSGDAPSAEAAG